MRSFALVVPVLLQSEEQARVLRSLLTRATDCGAAEIWVAEQGEPRLPARPAGVQHVVVPSSRRLIERSKLVNRVLPMLRADLVWIVDPDLELDLAGIGAALAASTEVAIQPFSELSREDRPAPVQVPIGKSSYLVEREILLALGGLSEAFIGPADEGLELVRRIRRFFTELTRLPHAAVQRNRRSTQLERAAARENKLLRQRLSEAIDRDPERYLEQRLESSLRADVPHVRELSRRRARATLFSAKDPHPPPFRPRSLPGTVWGITALFNPSSYRSKLTNYRAFRERLQRQGLPLVAVELAFGSAPFELELEDAERVVQLRAPDVLWQKERLLNVGLRHLPGDCDKVVWLDADVLFERDDWVAATSRELERYVVVQPFSRSVRLLPGETRTATDDLPVGAGEHEILHGMAWGVAAKGPGCLGRYIEHGHSGYAWAARRALLDRHGLYDANVLGNGDLNIAHAMFGGSAALKLERMSIPAQRHLARWADAFHADVGGSVGFIEGMVFHLWHGKKADRRYLDRLEQLPLASYDPELDLVEEESGAFRWASEKPELHGFCRDYFAARREDA